MTSRLKTESTTSDDPLISGQPCPHDEKMFEYLGALNQVVSTREDFNRTLEEGFIQIAKTRTILSSASLEFDHLKTESEESAVTFDVNDGEMNTNSDSLLLREVLKKACALPPSSLRTVQNCFNRIAKLSADLANAYNLVQSTAMKYPREPCNCDHEPCSTLGGIES